jgi:hypothetical protein
MFLSIWPHAIGKIVVRRIDYLFLAMIAFAAAVASAPPPPRVPILADAWVVSDSDQQTLTQLDLGGNATRP